MLHRSIAFKRAFAALREKTAHSRRDGALLEAGMAEAFTVQNLPADRRERYAALAEEVAAVIAGEPDEIVRMATISAMLAAAFEDFFWTGFYRVDPARPQELKIGPYQGTLGCLRIPFGRGVCGAAAASRRTLIVPDVEAFEGHIACDSRSRSEIVVPVLDKSGDLIAVLDVDSTELNTFQQADADGLEAIVALAFAG